MIPTRRRFTVTAVTLAVVLVTGIVGACGNGDDDGGDQAAELTKVRFMLSFTPSGQHAPWYVTQEKGFFEDAGLDVEILPGESSATTLATALAGEVDIAQADIASMVLAAQDEPEVGAKMVSVVYARPPYVIFSLKSGANIAELDDLPGSVIHLPDFSNNDEIVTAWAKTQGISGITFKDVDVEAANQLLIAGKIPAALMFVHTKPVLEEAAEQAGEELVTLDLNAAGFDDFYAGGNFATTDFIEDHPDVIRAFNSASARGFEYAFAHPEETGEIMNEVFPAIDPALTAEQMSLVENIITIGGTIEPIGPHDPALVEATVLYIEDGLGLKRHVDPETLYTNEFVD